MHESCVFLAAALRAVSSGRRLRRGRCRLPHRNLGGRQQINPQQSAIRSATTRPAVARRVHRAAERQM